MTVFILYRNTPADFKIMGVYTSQADADAGKATKIQNHLDNQNALRDAAYAAGESCDAVLVYEDVADFVSIVEKPVK